MYIDFLAVDVCKTLQVSAFILSHINKKMFMVEDVGVMVIILKYFND